MSNFLQDYGVFSGGNETPELYHVWAGFSVLASFAGRRVWVQQGIHTIYPNLYVILVGNASIGKSLAMDYANKILREFPEDVNIGPSTVTFEELCRFMGKECVREIEVEGEKLQFTPVTLYADELSVFLGTADPLKMINFLTQCWRSELFINATKNQGTDRIPGPCVNLLACMTPEVMSSMLKTNLISGGFTRRCLWVQSNKFGTPIPRMKITPEQEAARKRCVEAGRRILQASGEFKWEPGAVKVFDAWYEKKHEVYVRQTDPTMAGYYRTWDVMVLKVAMLIALSEGNELRLEAHHIAKAVELTKDMERTVRHLFLASGRNPLADVANTIAAFVESHPTGVVHDKVLYNNFYRLADRKELEQVLFHLEDSKTLRKELIGGKTCWMMPATYEARQKEKEARERLVRSQASQDELLLKEPEIPSFDLSNVVALQDNEPAE